MTVRYCIGIIGSGADEYRSRLQQCLRKRLRDLGKDLSTAVEFCDSDSVLKRDPKTPIVSVYFGNSSPPSDTDLRAVQSLRETVSVVIPAVPDLSKFHAAIPTALCDLNGISLSSDHSMDAIANLVLENLGLLRRMRRLFISYRHISSSHEAVQIRHELDARGYDVFLDSYSVPKGDVFQEVLWQRLADSDVAILLDTADFLDSRWTKEELAQAEAMTVGVVQVIWPGHAPAPYTDLCERIYLNRSDFKRSGGLVKQALERVTAAVEHLRARSLAARHDNLVREFCDAAASIDVSAVVQPERFISAKLPTGKDIAAIPAVGVPDALRYHEASRRFAKASNPPSQILLIYDHRGLRPSWIDFLDWLDDFLPVKAVRITDVTRKLIAQ